MIALMASYFFTDYRLQGQTIKYVVIDLGGVPNGSLSSLNVYITLFSRNRGHITISDNIVGF